MAYTTPANMIAQFGATEMARLASDDQDVAMGNGLLLATPQLLVDAANYADLSNYSAEERAAAATGIERIEHAITRAQRRIDSLLSTRYEQAFPLSTETIEANELAGMTADIARYFLSDDAPLDAVKTRFEFAMSWLKDLSAGRAALLGVDADTSRTGAGMSRVRHGQTASQFDWGTHPGAGPAPFRITFPRDKWHKL